MRVDKKRNPYVGPRSFERKEWDRDHFFGRDRETQEIVSLMFTHPLLLVYAQSGAGKTSLFNAKIAPTLEDEHHFQVLPLTRVSGPIPEGIEPQVIGNLYVFNALLGLQADPDDPDAKADPIALLGKSLAAFLEELPRSTSAGGRPDWRAIIFDQFEELFTSYPVGEREQHKEQKKFFEQVVEALRADPLLRVVLVIREDYLAQLDPFAQHLPGKLRTRFRIERLGRRAALDAVTKPLEDTGHSFERGVAEALVGDLMTIQVVTASGKPEKVKGEFVEPVQLQVACRSLWEELPDEASVISTKDLRRAYEDVDLAFVDLALARFYEQAIRLAVEANGTGDRQRDTPPEEWPRRLSLFIDKVRSGGREKKLRTWFGEELITPEQTRGTVSQGQTEASGISVPMVQALDRIHMVRSETRAGARWYELTHDRLIKPILKSNQDWEASRKERREKAFIASFAVLALLVFVVAVLALSKTNQAAREVQQAEATTTAVNVTAEKEVTQAAQQAEATTTAVKATATAGKATAEKEVTQAAQQAEDIATEVKATAEKEVTQAVQQAEATITAIEAIVAAEQAREAIRVAETPQLSQQGPAVDPLFSAGWQQLGGAGGPLGAPIDPPITDRNYAKQYFQQGFMYWWDDPDKGPDNCEDPDNCKDPIWVVAVPDPAVISGTTWMEYDDEWDGKNTFPPNCPEAAEPLGPRRGFGVTWCDGDAEELLGPAKELVGDPLEREFGSGNVYPMAIVQRFENGVMFDNLANREIWALIDEDGWYRFRY